ncbi:MAG: hypothetical protein AB9873_12865 [Syntrophobacteraceae bacterium]
MQAPHPLRQTDPNELRIHDGDGCTALFGIPFFIAGVFLLLLGVKVIPVQNATEVPGWTWPLMVLMGVVFAAVGGGLAFGRTWISLDRSRGVLLRQWGLLIPMRREEHSLHGYGSVVIRLETGDSDSADRYPVVLKSSGSQGDGDLTLFSPTDYGESFNSAAYLATFLGLPLVDAATEHESILQPERLTETFQERVRSRTDRAEEPPPPFPLRSQVDRSDGTVRIRIPGPDIKATALLGLIIPAVILFYAIPYLQEFFRRTHTPEYVQFFFLGLFVLFFGIVPVCGVARSLLTAKRSGTTITAGADGIAIEERIGWKTANTWIPAGDILDVDYSTAAGAMSAARSSADRFARRHSESGIPPRIEEELSQSWWVKKLRQLAKSKGIVVKSRSGLHTFAAGLPDEEVHYLHSVVRSALAANR